VRRRLEAELAPPAEVLASGRPEINFVGGQAAAGIAVKRSLGAQLQPGVELIDMSASQPRASR